MKFIVFYDVIDLNEMIKRYQKMEKLEQTAKKDNVPLVKPLSPPYAYAGLKRGFQLMEAENADALALLAGFYYGTSNFEFVPFIEAQTALEIQKTTTEALK